MADGSVTFKTDLDNAALEKKLAGIGKKIKDTEDALNQKKSAQSGIKLQLDAAKQAALETENRVKSLKNEISSLEAATGVDGGLLPEQYSEALDRKKAATAELKIQEAVLARQDKDVERIDKSYAAITDKVLLLTGKLDAQKDEYGTITQKIQANNSALSRTGDALNLAEKRLAKFTNRLKRLASRVMIFSVIMMALREIRAWMGKVIKTNSEATAAIARLKGALLTMAQPLLDIVIPALTAFLNYLARIATTAANVVSTLLGSTAEDSAKAAEGLYEETEALDGVGKSAKKAGKSLAGFDEINKLSGDSSSGSTEGSESKVAPDFNSVINEKMGAIEAAVGASLLALGAVLAFSGTNIPLGLGLMAAGAVTLGAVARENWDALYRILTGKLAPVLAYLSGSLLVLGAVIAFSGGNLGLGIGMMIAGAAGLATVAALNWDAITALLRGPIGVVTALVASSLLAVGAVLAFSGAHLGLGIGMMIIGAAGLATAAAVNWSTLQTVLQGPVGAILSLLSASLLVIGALVLFSGGNIPLGLGMMIAGAVGLAAPIAANWDAIRALLQGPLGVITSLVGGALLAVGAALAFSGANIPLGLSLLAMGAVGLGTSLALNWASLSSALQGPIGIITALVSGALLVLGAIFAFSGANIPLGIGLMVVGAIGMAADVAANWDTLTSLLSGPIGVATALVSGALLVIGAVLLFSGANIPLGLGLLVAGGVGLATAIAPNWDALLEAMQEAFNSIVEWWNNDVVPYWKELGSSIITGILDGLKSAWETITSWVSNAVEWIKSAFSGASSAAQSVTESAPQAKYSASPYIRNAAEVLSTASIPALARGAVIPPNREFMAVLGDQRNGNNLELPESLLRQIVREESGGTGGPARSQPLTIIVKPADGLTRYLSYELDAENVRRGIKLVKGV